MEVTERKCELCGNPIDADQAWLEAVDTHAVAHSGCVYSDTDAERRDRWMPPLEDAPA